MKLEIVSRSQAEQAAAELMEAMPAIVQFIRAEMRTQQEPSLSMSQLRVLSFLSRNPDISLSEVADYIGITRASASTMIHRLVQKGLVDRQEDPKERRHVMLKLTPSGSDRLEEMRDSTRQTIAHLLDNLNPDELKSISEGLALLGQVFHAANALR